MAGRCGTASRAHSPPPCYPGRRSSRSGVPAPGWRAWPCSSASSAGSRPRSGRPAPRGGNGQTASGSASWLPACGRAEQPPAQRRSARPAGDCAGDDLAIMRSRALSRISSRLSAPASRPCGSATTTSRAAGLGVSLPRSWAGRTQPSQSWLAARAPHPPGRSRAHLPAAPPSRTRQPCPAAASRLVRAPGARP